MGKLVVFTLVFGLSACTSARYLSDKSNPGYYQASPMRAVAHSPAPEGGNVGGYVGGEETAVTGLVLSALSLAANPDYYREDFITGRCLCRFSTEGEFEIPCMNVTVALLDERGMEKARVFSSDGEFVFSADADRAYHIKVHSDRYQTLTAPKRVRVGDDVSLHLMKK